MATTLTTPADVISVLKDHGFDDYSDNQLLVIINEVQNDVCALEPWPFLEAVYTAATTAGFNNVGLPATTSAVLHMINTTTGDVIVPMRWDQIDKNYPNYLTQQGAPQFYYFQGEVAFWYPIPDTTYNMYGGVQLQPTQLTATSDAFTWPTRHLWVIVLGCLVHLYQMEDDANMSQYYQAAFDGRLTRAREDIWKLQYDRPDMIGDIMGDYWF